MSSPNGHANGASQDQKPHVCVVGAGICGLAAIKACLAEGLRVTCYERSSNYGGLWCYRPDHDEQKFEPSVMRTTILNTSKELSAFSDFPPPPELPNFMRHNLYMNYISSYVEHFKLMPHIVMRHEILHCRPEWNTEKHQIKWQVRMRRLDDNQEFEQEFDKLIVAVGHHNIPFEPTYKGQQKFRGKIMHSARLKDVITNHERFADKRIVVVGLGNSACDAANDISLISSKCYVSCHRGQWFTSRYLIDGPYDSYIKSRVYNYTSKLVPERILDNAITKRLERRTNHFMLGLKPKHRPSEQVPAINDLLPYKIYTGGVCLKGNISEFTENGVIFEGEEGRVYEVDMVILATGYIGQVKFMDEQALGFRSSQDAGDEYELFLNIFAPNFQVPNNESAVFNGLDCSNKKSSDEITTTTTSTTTAKTAAEIQKIAIKSFAFVGLVQPNGSLTVISELQSRLVARIFADKLELPSDRVMRNQIERMKRVRSRSVRSHSRDQLIGNYVDYVDSIAEILGVRPNLTKLFLKDFPLWKQLMFGPSVSYQFRLDGPGKWPGARETIMKVNDRIYCGINEGKNHLLYKNRRKCLNEQQRGKQ